ncbi:MAG TPA: NUDIX domain-containing protein [Ktedonobacterales bacterium]|nr:NUDIX domain-containing protein [Ktedonobacterales bacterium]
MQEINEPSDGMTNDDPFAEFYEKYEADVADITIRHDYYIGEEALETHMVTPDRPQFYQQGYSIGAGAVVLCGEKVLLVRLGYGAYKDSWALPGGYVEAGETFDVTVQREVHEETGVQAEMQGLIAARSRVNPGDNSAYLIFLLRADHEEAQADGAEVLDARFFTRDEAMALPSLTPMTRLLLTRVFAGELHILKRLPVPTYPTSEFVLFI